MASGRDEIVVALPKGKLLELMTHRCHPFRVPTDSRIEGLGGARGVRALGVDSVADDSSDVVGSVPSERMEKGPGKAEETDDSEDTTERLATDSGSGIPLMNIVVDTDRVVTAGELIVGESGGWRGNCQCNVVCDLSVKHW